MTRQDLPQKFIILSLIFIIGFILILQPAKQTLPKRASKAHHPEKSITIFWAEWAPAHDLQALGKEFTKETGIKVIVKTSPFTRWQNETFQELNKHAQTFDLIVGDSQWLGRGSTEGHYIELTRWIKEKEIDKTMTAASLSGYAEYPKGSGKYWGVPLEGDAMGWAYRKDKFEDPKEMAAFKAKYGYELAVPKTWAELRDIAEFFYRPNENFYGVSIITMEAYDGITMGFENVLFSFGGEWGTNDYKIKGVVNSENGKKALEFYKELYKFCPPGWEHAFWTEDAEAITQGKTAMSMNFFAFFPDLINPKINPYAHVTGFFANPKGPDGKNFSALGGMGISLISYSKKKDLAFLFLAWLAKDAVQQKWADLGGYTCDKDVLNSGAFLKATPYNKAFKESMEMVKDFWVTPEYDTLLAVSQKYLHGYVVDNQFSSREALDLLADDWENIFEYAGYYKE
ncbi:MAG: extracellular solute-binding protein [Candidatus Omnitrophica bacterium]|nr:extracellular solute-binding protein [Candidatus Omnitrophota bacterium]